MTGFIGQYCHGNQPGHNIPYAYYFVGKQEKSQHYINQILDRFYDMGADKLAYAGMDDAGEMSSWYVWNAMGLYTYSPADPEYIRHWRFARNDVLLLHLTQPCRQKADTAANVIGKGLSADRVCTHSLCVLFFEKKR